MSVAVPPASLYADHVYHQGLHLSAPESIITHHRSQCRTTEWLEVRTRLNRAPWDATRHVPTTTGATDASPQAWRCLIRRPFDTVSIFKAAADFSAERYNAHINVKKALALHEVLKLATTALPSCLKGSTAVDDADNEAMHDACKKERPRNAQSHDLIKKLIWHQLEEVSPRLRGELFDHAKTDGAPPAILDRVR